jgi:hypothetical protein
MKMKKLFIIGILVALLLIAVPAMAFVCTSPTTTQVLYAGQTLPVGSVTVCNDETNLYVTFTTTGTNYMRETHLAVETLLSDIPQTKTGNPIPGKFEYKTTHVPAVKETTYTILLASLGTGPYYIAAHASLDKEDVMTFFSAADGKTKVTAVDGGSVAPYSAVLAWQPGPDYPNDGSNDAAWRGANSLWNKNLNPPTSFTPGDWIWNEYRVSVPTSIHSVTFENAFNVPGEPTSGTLWIADDNMYSVSLNGASVGSQTNWENWAAVGTYPILPTTGLNTLQVVGTNYGDASFTTASSNPAGLIFKGEVKYLVPSETAWAAGSAFPGKNWATYFPYTVHGCTPVGTVDVPALNNPLVTTAYTFESGKTYKLKASGTATANEFITFDAKYSINDGDGGTSLTWTDSVFNYEYLGPELLDLYVNGQNVDWGAYNSAHVYEIPIAGTGIPATFQFQINDFYSSNDGGILTVDICKEY